MTIWLNKHQVCNGFPPKFSKCVKSFLLLIFLHGFLFCSPELFFYRYMYRNVHTLPPGRVIFILFPSEALSLHPWLSKPEVQNLFTYNKWLTMFFKTRGLFSVISHRPSTKHFYPKTDVAIWFYAYIFLL